MIQSNRTIFAGRFLPYFVVVFAGRQPACILRLVRRKSAVQIFACFLLDHSIQYEKLYHILIQKGANHDETEKLGAIRTNPMRV